MTTDIQPDKALNSSPDEVSNPESNTESNTETEQTINSTTVGARQNWKAFLIEHYTGDPQAPFKQFKLGGMLFFLGMVMIYIANRLFLPSISQELITLAGISIIAIGFLIAMLSQVRMIIGRTLSVYLDKPSSKRKDKPQ